jgi:hypothetical protein
VTLEGGSGGVVYKLVLCPRSEHQCAFTAYCLYIHFRIFTLFLALFQLLSFFKVNPHTRLNIMLSVIRTWSLLGSLLAAVSHAGPVAVRSSDVEVLSPRIPSIELGSYSLVTSYEDDVLFNLYVFLLVM